MVTRGWNGYRNKSQHRKSTLEKKILPPFQQGFEPATWGFICAGVNFVGGYKWHALFYFSCLSTDKKPLVSWQFSGPYGVTKYGSGWRKWCRKPVLGVWIGSWVLMFSDVIQHIRRIKKKKKKKKKLRLYLWWNLCTLYLHACQVRVTVGDSGLHCTCGAYFERWCCMLIQDISYKLLDI